MAESYAVRVYKEYMNFGSAHFLIFADGSREELHGHNYHVRVKVEGDVVEGDLVVDFIPLKPLVKAFCDELDHVTLLPDSNPHLEVTQQDGTVEARHTDGSLFILPARDVRILPIPNTSTEMLARYLAQKLVKEIPTRLPSARLKALEIEVEESPGQCGVYRIEL